MYLFSKECTLLCIRKSACFVYLLSLYKIVSSTSCTAFTSVQTLSHLSSSQNAVLSQITRSQLFLIAVIPQITANYDILKSRLNVLKYYSGQHLGLSVWQNMRVCLADRQLKHHFSMPLQTLSTVSSVCHKL